MATNGATLVTANLSPISRRKITSVFREVKATAISPKRSVRYNEQAPTNVRLERKKSSAETLPSPFDNMEIEKLSVNDFFERSKDLIRSDGGPPRWFSPLECSSRMKNSPLLLFLPGIDGVGLGLILHHQRLGKIFDIWCLHIPVMDRTPFTGLVELVERTVQSENSHLPNRPIYLVGESLGACLALAVAARNPDIDLMLILANPATSFSKSQLQLLTPFLGVIPNQLHVGLPYVLSLATGDPLRMVMASVEKGLVLQQTVEELSQILSVFILRMMYVSLSRMIKPS